MVKLSYIIYTHAPLPKVWNYFARFQNVSEWDPNVKSSKISKKTDKVIGSVYDLVTIFNGKQSQIQYKMTDYEQMHKIQLYGQNTMVSATDQILFREKGSGTEIEYKADICLRHIFGLFTPLIRKDLDKLVVQAKSGMTKKCQELFGTQ